MNIGLIGAPGSGKSSLAYRLANSLTKDDPSCGCGERNVKIVDHYVPEIETKTQIAIGMTTNYLGNLYVALERHVRERVARMEHDIVITCGTLVETAVYTATQFVALQAVLDDVTKQEALPRIDAAIRMLAVLYNDIVIYDYAFYLPLQPEEEESENQFIDQQLKAGVEGFKLAPVTVLANPETRLEDALAAIGAKSADN